MPAQTNKAKRQRPSAAVITAWLTGIAAIIAAFAAILNSAKSPAEAPQPPALAVTTPAPSQPLALPAITPAPGQSTSGDHSPIVNIPGHVNGNVDVNSGTPK